MLFTHNTEHLSPFVHQIGFIGLVEEDWLATLATIDSDELEFFDFVTMGTKLAKELRDEVLVLILLSSLYLTTVPLSPILLWLHLSYSLPLGEQWQPPSPMRTVTSYHGCNSGPSVTLNDNC